MQDSMTKIGLKDRKVARIRLALVRHLREKLNEMPFNQIRVEDLCEVAMISKVTFFKYFPEKDALLVFSNACWIMELQVLIRRKELVGIPAIAEMYASMGRVCNESPHSVRAFYGMISENLKFPMGVELSRADKLELFPDEDPDGYETRSTGNFIHRHIQYALDHHQIATNLDQFEISSLIGSIFNGTGVLGLRLFPDRPGDLFAVNIGILYKCLNYKGIQESPSKI